MSEIKLPNGWVDTAFENVLDKIVGGGTPSKLNLSFFKGQIPFMTVKDMTTRFPTDTVDHISDEAVESSATTMVPKDSLIVATRMSLGKIVRPKFDTAINQDLKALFLTDGMHKTYIEYFWRSKANHIQDLGTGTTVKGIRLEDIRSLTIPLAPLPEQKRIADKLDTVLARVDACRERLNRVPLILKRFKQSVLAAATSGKLTEDWRAKEVVNQASWQTQKAEALCEWITKGTTPSKEKMTDAAGDVPYIKVYNLCFDGALDFTVNPTFVDQDTHQNVLKRSVIFPGDVLMNIVGPPLGKVSIVPNTYPEWNINQAIAVFRAKSEIDNRYLAYFLMNENTINDLIGKSKATAGQFNLTLEICRQIDVPLPLMAEQIEIVRRVETLFAFADRLEVRISRARNATERLTPALLAKAFRGELVEQDPNDEPASLLLKRLAENRDSADVKPSRGRTLKKENT